MKSESKKNMIPKGWATHFLCITVLIAKSLFLSLKYEIEKHKIEIECF